MKVIVCVLCLLAACADMPVHAKDWQPANGHRQIALWSGTPPDAKPMPGPETMTVGSHLKAGKPVTWVWKLSRPTVTVYAPKGKNAGAAIIVFPGGGFQGLAINLEGTEPCRWLTSIGVTCVLVKYRVPSAPYRWQCKCYPDHTLAESVPALEDAERAVRLVRSHAAQWHVDPHRVGVLGFSAGGFLVAELSTVFNHRLYSLVDVADEESCRPDFALAIYPGHLEDGGVLNPLLTISRETPPTFLVQAEDDHPDGVDQSLVYFTALAKAGVPAELHIYAGGWPWVWPEAYESADHALAEISRRVVAQNRHYPELTIGELNACLGPHDAPWLPIGAVRPGGRWSSLHELPYSGDWSVRLTRSSCG